MISKVWIAMFSKTGSELREVCERVGRYPDRVLTTNEEACFDRYLNIIKNPSVEDYRKIAGDPIDLFGNDVIITLHGFMKIIPDEICKEYKVYNGHPGDIVLHPELKGLDPQQKAIDLGLQTTGCVIHRVTPEIDSGEIMARQGGIYVREELEKDLHNISIDLWVGFLRRML